MNEQIKKKDDLNKLALKSGVWYVFSSIILKAILLLTTPIFTRLMSTEEFGITSTFNSWCALFLVFCTLNLTYSVGRAKIDFPEKLDEYIGAMQVLTITLSSSLGIVFIIYARHLTEVFELPLVGIYWLIIYLESVPIINLYQTGTRYRYKYKENIAIGWYTGLLGVVLPLLFIFFIDGQRSILRIAGNVIPLFVLAIFLLIKSARGGNLKYNKEYWKYGVSLSAPLVLHELSHSVLSQSDRIFIAKMCGAVDTGIYSIAYNYGCLMSIVTNAIANGWLPWFHDMYFEKEFGEIKKNSRLVVVLGCYIGLACVALAPEAVLILGGTQYIKGIYCIAPVTMGIVCQYIYTHYVNIEMHLKKTKFVPIGTCIAASLNLVLNYIFIPIYGFVAASYTTFISYFVLMVAHYIYTRYILKVKLYDDYYMFGAIFVTSVIARVLSLSYDYTLLRYILLSVGFLSFLLTYRMFIVDWLKKKGILKRR